MCCHHELSIGSVCCRGRREERSRDNEQPKARQVKSRKITLMERGIGSALGVSPSEIRNEAYNGEEKPIKKGICAALLVMSPWVKSCEHNWRGLL